MSDATAYPDLATTYVAGVRALLLPGAPADGERGLAAAAPAPSSYEEAALRAGDLAAVSAELTAAAAAGLEDDGTDARLQAADRLLAKALSDLEVGAYLLQAAIDEQDELAFEEAGAKERGLSGAGALEESLALLLGEGPDLASRAAERGGGGVAEAGLALGGAGAGMALATAVDDALLSISERAAEGGQRAFAGLLGMGAGELVSAAGLVGTGVAGAFGQAEAMSRLLAQASAFVSQSFEAVAALLGPGLLQVASDQVLTWVDELRGGALFGTLLEKLYETRATAEALQGRLADTGDAAEAEPLAKAAELVAGLEAAYGQQIRLAEQVLDKMKLVALVPAALVPQGRLVVAAVYIVLGGYIVLAGADFVDAPRVTLLRRVPGVRRLVEDALGDAPAG